MAAPGTTARLVRRGRLRAIPWERIGDRAFPLGGRFERGGRVLLLCWANAQRKPAGGEAWCESHVRPQEVRSQGVGTLTVGGRQARERRDRVATYADQASRGQRFRASTPILGRVARGGLRAASEVTLASGRCLPTLLAPGLRTAAGGACRGRKVRAPQGKVVGNAHRPQGQGKCHREQTAGRPSRATARVKRRGKSSPRTG